MFWIFSLTYRIKPNYYLNRALPLTDGSGRSGYDGVEVDFFFFGLFFRHPADFVAARHPFGFFLWGFFQLLFFAVRVCEAAANGVVEPAKNIRPVTSAIMTRNVFGIFIPFHEPALEGQLLPGSGEDVFPPSNHVKNLRREKISGKIGNIGGRGLN